MTGRKAIKGEHHIGRSSGPQDVKDGWLLESATRSIGPYIDYGTSVAERASGKIIWREGDPRPKPKNPEREKYKKPHNPGYFGGGGR